MKNKFIWVLFLQSLIFLFPSKLHSTKIKKESESFIFIYDKGVRGLAEKIIENSEKIKKEVERTLGLKANFKIVIEVAEDDASFSKMVGIHGNVDEWIAGIAFSGERRIVLSGRGNEIFKLEDTFIHELVHIFLSSISSNIPRWFNEGMAMLLAGEDVLQRLKLAISANIFNNLIPIKELENRFPPTPPLVHLAYAESLIFVRFIVKKKGIGSIHSIINYLKYGQPFENAFFLAVGYSTEDMFNEWIKSLEDKHYWLVFLSSSIILWSLITILFLGAYMRKKIRAKKKLRMMEIEEELQNLKYGRKFYNE